MPFVLLWLQAFALTLALETAVALPLLAPAEPRRWRRLCAIAVANLASHPAVWFVFPELGDGHPDVTLALSEAWAFASELGIYLLVFPARPLAPALSARRAALIAGLANALSFATGWWLRAQWHWP